MLRREISPEPGCRSPREILEPQTLGSATGFRRSVRERYRARRQLMTDVRSRVEEMRKGVLVWMKTAKSPEEAGEMRLGHQGQAREARTGQQDGLNDAIAAVKAKTFWNMRCSWAD